MRRLKTGYDSSSDKIMKSVLGCQNRLRLVQDTCAQLSVQVILRTMLHLNMQHQEDTSG